MCKGYVHSAKDMYILHKVKKVRRAFGVTQILQKSGANMRENTVAYETDLVKNVENGSTLTYCIQNVSEDKP
jgi:hypothetical protein